MGEHNFETCTYCKGVTGRAGISDDSLYCNDCGAGPFCEDCYDPHEEAHTLSAALKRAETAEARVKELESEEPYELVGDLRGALRDHEKMNTDQECDICALRSRVAELEAEKAPKPPVRAKTKVFSEATHRRCTECNEIWRIEDEGSCRCDTGLEGHWVEGCLEEVSK